MFIPTNEINTCSGYDYYIYECWNSYMGKVIMTESKSMTMPMVVANLTEGYVTDYGMLMLAVLIYIAYCLSIILQKSFGRRLLEL